MNEQTIPEYGMTMHEIHTMRADYRAMGYIDYIGPIDYEVASESQCEQCDTSMRGIGMRHPEHPAIGEYHAWAICDTCGYGFLF